MPDFQTLNTRTEGAVLFAEINSPPMNLLGTALVTDLVSLIELLDKGDRYRVVVFSSADPDYFYPPFHQGSVRATLTAAVERRVLPDVNCVHLFLRISHDFCHRLEHL
jgi:hypothetical protein